MCLSLSQNILFFYGKSIKKYTFYWYGVNSLLANIRELCIFKPKSIRTIFFVKKVYF